MLRTICILVFMSHLSLSAQEVNWHGFLNEAWFNNLQYSTRDSIGNRYFCGNFNGTADLDPNPDATAYFGPAEWQFPYPFIGKLDANYNLDWVKTLSAEKGKIGDLLPTKDGGLLFTSYAETFIDLDPSDDTLIINANWFEQGMLIVCKWDINLKPEWYWEVYPGSPGNRSIILPHPQGGYLLLVSSSGAKGVRNKQEDIAFSDPGNGDIFMIHLDEDGSFIKHTNIGSASKEGDLYFLNRGESSKYCVSFPALSDSFFYLTGIITGSPTLQVDGSNFTYSPLFQAAVHRSFIATLNYDGEYLSFNQIEGGQYQFPQHIISDGEGGLYYIGYFNDSLYLPNGMDTIKLVSQKHSLGLSEDADMIIGRLDSTNTWLWARHLDGGFGGIWSYRTSATSSLNSNMDLIVIASTLADVYVDPNGTNRRILSQTKGNTAFSMRVSPNGEISCGNPLMRMDTLDPHLYVTGLDKLDTNQYFWYGTYWDQMELFDGTPIQAGSAASYMIDASFCPEYPCASIESTPCGDTLRACTWSTTSWRWFKDGVHLPESDGDSILVTQENGTYMLVAYLEDGCPYQRPDTTMIVVDHYIRFNLVVEPVNCKWGENGTAQVMPFEGAGPFGYSLDGINFDSISIFTGLDPGDYKVFVNSEAHGCLYSDSFSITTLEATHLKDTRCYGDTLSVGNYTFYEGLIDTLLFLDNVLHPGCDSTIRLEVQFKDPVQIISVQSYVCDSALTVIDTLITPYHDFVICDSLMSISQKILAPSWYIDTTIYICQGDSILINGVWYDEPTFVEAQMVSSLGCDSILLLDLQVIQPPVFEAFKDTFVASGTTLTLEAPFQNGYIYNWQPPDNLSCQNCPAPQIIAEADQSLTLYFADAQGCFSHTVQYDIKVYAEEIAVPNMFTPNGDGVNDLFGVIVVKGPPESIKIHNFSIFNRWGKQIFNSQDVLNVWDGLHSGEPCPMDNYGWVLDVEFANGKREVLRGHVSLVR